MYAYMRGNMRTIIMMLKYKLKLALIYLYLSTTFYKLYKGAKKYAIKHPKGTIKLLPAYSDFKFESLQGEKVTLFVVYQPKSFLMYERYFDLLRKLNTKIIVISNGPLNNEFIERFSSDVVAIAERENIGRDFGAYKEFFLTLFDKNIVPKNVTICNDSMFANLKKEDNRFVEFLLKNDDADYVGAAEFLGEPNYHVQSYFLRLSNNVLQGKHFIQFWKSFFITDNRRANIHNGEIKLSQSILKDGFRPVVFLGSDNFIHYIIYNKPLLKRFLVEFSANHHLEVGGFDWGAHFNKIYLNICSNKFSIEQKEIFLEQLKIDIPKLLNRSGIISIVPFLIIDEFGFPFLKRDLVYHEIVDWMLIRDFGKDFDQDLLEDYIQDQRIRKRPWYFKSLKDKLMFRFGMI